MCEMYCRITCVDITHQQNHYELWDGQLRRLRESGVWLSVRLKGELQEIVRGDSGGDGLTEQAIKSAEIAD